MKRAVYLRMCLLAICAVVFTFVATFAVGLYTFRVQMVKDLEIQTKSLATGYNHAQDKQGFLESLAFTPPPRITVISADGTVDFDNYVNPTTMENHNDRPEVIEARKNGRAEKVRFSGTLEEQSVYYAVRTQNNSIIRLAQTNAIVLTMLKLMQPFFIVLILVILLLAIFIASRLTRKIVTPINQLDLDNPLENEIYEELTPLLTKIHKQKIQINSQLETLNKNKKEFNVIIENMAEGMVLLDCQMNIISTNRSAVNLLKAGQQDYTGRNLVMLSRNTNILDMVEMALRGSNSNRVISINSVYLELLANPVESKGKIIGCVLLILDVSDKYMAEQSRKEFTANVSHELKTPLTSISGYAEMLLLGLAKDEDIKHFASKIHCESSHLINLVEDILELSKLKQLTLWQKAQPQPNG
jgi:two-component system phosphate regulon sensor histidine kinase PhoR